MRRKRDAPMKNEPKEIEQNIQIAERTDVQPLKGVMMYVPKTRKSTIETASLISDSPAIDPKQFSERLSVWIPSS